MMVQRSTDHTEVHGALLHKEKTDCKMVWIVQC